MTALGWSIQKHDKLVIVNGVGVFDLPFFLAYLQAMEGPTRSAIASSSISARPTSG